MPPIESGFVGLLCHRALEIHHRLLEAFLENGRAASGLRIMAGLNWLVLHNTPAVSAHQKRAARVFRFEYSKHYLAVQRVRSSDASG